MARSFSRPGPADRALASKAAYVHQPSQTTFAFSLKNNELVQHRFEAGPAGAPDNVEDLRVDYVMGSGNHARTYLHRDTDGTLIELPLAWYAEAGGTTAMNPGFDNPHPPTRRVITYECMFCHNGYPDVPDATHADFQATPIYNGELPHGITCQRCHGPGQRHVAAAEAPGTSLERIRNSIVNPARLAHPRQMEVCEQCHLQITSQPLPDRIRHFDKAPFDYAAGKPLREAIDYFTRDPALASPKNFEIVSAPYRLRQSRCFRESSGALTCQTCHNPHDLRKGPSAQAYFANICLTCHRAALTTQVAEGRHPAATECISCHMPLRRTEDVVHVSMHDHLIARPARPEEQWLRPLREVEPSVANAYRGEVKAYEDHFDASRPDAALYLALAQVLADSNSNAGIARLEDALRTTSAPKPQFYLALGDAQMRANKGAAAIASYRSAYTQDPLSEPAARSLGVALAAAGQTGEAESILGEALARSPASALLWYEKGRIELQASEASRGKDDLREALRVKPSLAQASNDLGLALAQAGDLDAAESAFRTSLAGNPFEASAQANLANVLASKGNLQDAAFYLEKALRLAPASPSAHLSYAAVLAGRKRYAQALTQAKAAVALDPTSCAARAQSAEILAQTSQFAAAGQELKACLSRTPGDARANLDYGFLQLALKQPAAAVAFLRQAAVGGDPAIAARAQALLGQLGAR